MFFFFSYLSVLSLLFSETFGKCLAKLSKPAHCPWSTWHIYTTVQNAWFRCSSSTLSLQFHMFPIFSFCIAFIFLYPTPLGFNYIFFHLNTTTGFIVERHRMCWGSIMIHLAAYFLSFKQQVFWGSVILHDKGNMHGRSYKQSNLDPVHIILVHVSMGFQDYLRSNGIWSYL